MNGRRKSGFTIIEVLVALVVLSVATVFISSLLTALRLNASSSSTIEVNQAAQQYVESVQNAWRGGVQPYGQLPTAGLAAPATLAQYNWTVTVCQVDATYACANPLVAPQGTAPSYTAVPASVDLMRITVAYEPAGVRGGSPITTTAEVARP